MGSLLDACAENKHGRSVMRTREMSRSDAVCAIDWFSRRIRAKTGDDTLCFPGVLIPETGLSVCNQTDSLLAVATLYLEKSSPVAVCGWCIANPDNPASVSYAAISLLMAEMPFYAKKHKAEYLLTTFGDRGINAILDKQGFVNGEKSENKFMVLR